MNTFLHTSVTCQNITKYMTTGKASNAEVMGNDMESPLPADLNFEISDDVLSNMPLPDYGSNVIQNFSGSVFNNCTINFVQK